MILNRLITAQTVKRKQKGFVQNDKTFCSKWFCPKRQKPSDEIILFGKRLRFEKLVEINDKGRK
jgi:hypothetical protein